MQTDCTTPLLNDSADLDHQIETMGDEIKAIRKKTDAIIKAIDATRKETDALKEAMDAIRAEVGTLKQTENSLKQVVDEILSHSADLSDLDFLVADDEHNIVSGAAQDIAHNN